jgi:DNA-binding SARP family transcriptional activator
VGVTEFRLLGPVEAVVDGAAVVLGAPKQRALLAELLLHRAEVVGRSHLVDSLWGERAPDSALSSLQVYVHGLRRALGAERIETHGAGYRIAVRPDELDVDRFERLLDRGAAARSFYARRSGSGAARRSPISPASRLPRRPVRSRSGGSSRSSSGTRPTSCSDAPTRCSPRSTS